MKTFLTRTALFALCASFFVLSCAEDSTTITPELTVAIDEEASTDSTITVIVETNAETSVSSNRSWCQVASATTQSGEFKITTTENTGRFERSAQVTFENGGLTESVTVTQEKGEYTAGMHYEIPIVFHIIYSNSSSEQHNVSQEKIYEIFDNLCEIYDTCSQDMNFDFVLAEEDENGSTLAEPGINRIQQALYQIECLDLMYESTGEYKSLAWDPRKYLNVTIYEFADEFSIIGLSRAPYLVDPYELEGVIQLLDYTHPDDLPFIYTISLNNAYLYPEESDSYNMYDFGEMLAHEIGHYLGLFHPYSETYVSGVYDSCDDTDYCEDTPSYNRYKYEEVMFYVDMSYVFDDEDIETLSWRTSCLDGSSFRANNIMDYAICDTDTFTADQAARMRYILENSPYIPGCKSEDYETMQAAPTGISNHDIPIKCHVHHSIECEHHQ